MRVYPERTLGAFEGRLLRCGSNVEEAELRPTEEYPEVPLLLEFAGHDASGSGHRRSNHVHILWKLNRKTKEFEELARVKGQGAEWIYHLKPIIIRELHRAEMTSSEIAWQASLRILRVLDDELERLQREGKAHLMSFLHDEFTARLVNYSV